MSLFSHKGKKEPRILYKETIKLDYGKMLRWGRVHVEEPFPYVPPRDKQKDK